MLLDKYAIRDLEILKYIETNAPEFLLNTFGEKNSPFEVGHGLFWKLTFLNRSL
jgi:hypothetical protein